jgi:hypothetical protein
MDQTPLPQRGAKVLLERADQPRGAVADAQQRRTQPAADQVGQEVVPGVGRLRAGRCQAHEHGLAVGVDAPGGQHRLGGCARVHLEVRGVQEQVVQPQPGQVAGAPSLELVFDPLADAAHRGAAQRRFGTEHLGQGGLDVAVGQAPHPARDHQRLQGVGAGHASAEQPRAERLVGAAQLGALQLHGTHRGLHRRRWLPAVAGAGPVLIGAALVAGPPQERIDLCLQGGLQQQPHAQAGDVLQDLSKGLVGREQLVDLGTGAFGGQYSSCHGRRSSFVLSQVRGNLRPLRTYTRDRTPPRYPLVSS